LKSSPNNPNNAKIQTILLNRLFLSKCNKLVSKDVTIFGHFLDSKNHNETTKNSLIVEKIAQSNQNKLKIRNNLENEGCSIGTNNHNRNDKQ
jgi:hypothetical protein